ncbi:hypothetical protein ACQZ4X_19355 [Agrobacterium vitis]
MDGDAQLILALEPGIVWRAQAAIQPRPFNLGPPWHERYRRNDAGLSADLHFQYNLQSAKIKKRSFGIYFIIFIIPK